MIDVRPSALTNSLQPAGKKHPLTSRQSTQISRTTQTSVPTLIEEKEENVFQKSHSRCRKLFFVNYNHNYLNSCLFIFHRLVYGRFYGPFLFC